MTSRETSKKILGSDVIAQGLLGEFTALVERDDPEGIFLNGAYWGDWKDLMNITDSSYEITSERLQAWMDEHDPEFFESWFECVGRLPS